MPKGEETGRSEAARLLGHCHLFRDLEAPDLVALGAYARRRRAAAGDLIFRASDPGESLMVIASGVVRISRTAANGDDLIIADLEPGDVFGEIALLDGGGRSADASAVTNAELIVLERRDFIAFLIDRPLLAIGLLTLLCSKLRLADERASDFLFLELSDRLAKALLAHSAPRGENAEKARKISLTQGELGKLIGASRSKVNRQLKDWQRQGLIEISKGWIVVDRVRLARLAAGTR